MSTHFRDRAEVLADLLAEVEAYLDRNPMPETTFGKHAVNDGKFMTRLRAGQNMTLDTVDRVRRFLRESENTEEASATEEA